MAVVVVTRCDLLGYVDFLHLSNLYVSESSFIVQRGGVRSDNMTWRGKPHPTVLST